jgi:hypothetical protein
MKALVVQILYHFGLGISLCALTWLVGWAWLVSGIKKNHISRPEEALYAYPIGLLHLVIGSALATYSSWLIVPVLLLSVYPFIPAVRKSRITPAWKIAAYIAPIGIVLPLILRFAFTLGLRYHGPTAQLAGSPYGDMRFYASLIYTYKDSIFPARDLLIEGFKLGYAERASTVIGAFLLYLPRFDPFLFNAVACPAFFLSSMCLSTGLWSSQWRVGSSGNSTVRVVVGVTVLLIYPLLCLASIAYPSWLVESPPVALALPLVFAALNLAQDRDGTVRRHILMGLIILACVFLTKIFLVLPFGILFSAAFIMNTNSHSQRYIKKYWIAIITAFVGGGFVLFYTLKTYFWIYKLFTPQFRPLLMVSNPGKNFGLALDILGQLLVATGTFGLNYLPVLLSLTSSIIANWVLPAFTDIVTGGAFLLAALVICRNPDRPVIWRASLALGSLFLCYARWLREVPLSDKQSAQILFLTMALSIMVSLRPLAAALKLRSHLLQKIFAWAILLVGAETMTVFAEGLLTRQIEPTHGKEGFRTVADYDVWTHVRMLTPADCLIFFDSKPFDYYMGTAQRQFYLGSWYNSPLRDMQQLLDKLSTNNKRVLRGELSPRNLNLSRAYSEYYAVVDKNHPPPAGWVLLYSNWRFSLYRVPSKG